MCWHQCIHVLTVQVSRSVWSNITSAEHAIACEEVDNKQSSCQAAAAAALKSFSEFCVNVNSLSNSTSCNNIFFIAQVARHDEGADLSCAHSPQIAVEDPGS